MYLTNWYITIRGMAESLKNEQSPINHAEIEEEILASDKGALEWLKTAISPFLSASSAVITDEAMMVAEGIFTVEEEYEEVDDALKENCAQDGCTRMLGPKSSQFACPSCDKKYCSTHSGHPSFEVTLPESSVNVRICASCWMSRPENKTGPGSSRNWMEHFNRRRIDSIKRLSEKKQLFQNRLSNVAKL